MVTVEAMQAMMAHLQEQNANNLATLARQQMEALQAIVARSMRAQSTGGMTDTRGIGRPVTFKGDEGKYAEWKAKLNAYLRIMTAESDGWMKWACNEGQTITEESLDLEFGQQSGVVKEFSIKLYSILMSCTEDDAFRICHSVKDGNGLEALRLVAKRYEPRTPATKRALLKVVINNPQAKDPKDIEKNLMRVEELMKKYEVLAGQPLPEDLRATVIIDLCTKDLKEHLELTTREMSYKEVREEIMAYVERKRDLFGSQLKAMECDNHEEQKPDDKPYNWWGGAADQWYDGSWCEEPTCGDMCPMQAQWGKGPRADYKGGKGWYKGGEQWKGNWMDKGGKKGGGKGTGGKDGKGKGKGGGFQGHCHWCGEWGHSQSRCLKKDEYMDAMRKNRGQANNVESEEKPKNDLEALEKSQGWRTLCYLGTNRFGALAEEDEESEEEYEDEVMNKYVTCPVCPPAPGLEEKSPKFKKVKKEWNSLQGKGGNPEINAMSGGGSKEDLWITVDSGASENVIAESMAPQFKVKESQGSRDGVVYVAANGETMPNRGEKDVKVVTAEGHKCMLKMQVTDVQKPLMSVARICDAGHRVVFEHDGGYVEHKVTKQRTNFNRVDNVYRLRVGLASSEAGFTRQGR